MSEWINIQDRMPPYPGLVGIRRIIVFCGDGSVKFAIMRWVADEKLRGVLIEFYPLHPAEYLSQNGDYGEQIRNVSHWFNSPWSLEFITSDDWIDLTTSLARCPSPMRCICAEYDRKQKEKAIELRTIDVEKLYIPIQNIPDVVSQETIQCPCHETTIRIKSETEEKLDDSAAE